jgi:Pvc16 N-terminal domain
VSDPLAIAGVTAVLQYWLSQVCNGPSSPLGSVLVSAQAPDIIQSKIAAGSKQLQINVFMHQVTANAAWRNVDLPSIAPDGGTRLSSPPLALDLHYLLTAYAVEDTETEALLGYAILMLHQTPIFARADIRTALSNVPHTNPLWSPLAATGLADQIEMIKVTPSTLGREEMAWIWTALKADYRATYPFQVSVVLIQPEETTVSALPVLRRNVSVIAGLTPPFPTLAAVVPPNGRSAAVLGDTVTVEGTDLAAANGVRLVNSRLGIDRLLTSLANVQDDSFQFTIPNPPLPPPQPNPGDLPAGVYTLTARVPSGSDVLSTNGLPFAVAPRIKASWGPGTIGAGPNVSVSVPCAPYLRPSQQASLIIGGQQAPADSFSAPTNSPSFTFEMLESTSGDSVPVRLRVDGIDSPIIDLSAPDQPVFTGPTVLVT